MFDWCSSFEEVHEPIPKYCLLSYAHTKGTFQPSQKRYLVLVAGAKLPHQKSSAHLKTKEVGSLLPELSKNISQPFAGFGRLTGPRPSVASEYLTPQHPEVLL